MLTDRQRMRLLRRAAAALALAVVATACGDAPSSQRTVAAQTSPGAGAIDAVSELADGELEVVGWIATEAPRTVEIATATATVSVTADQRRADLATIGTSAFGFRVVLETTRSGEVCLAVDGRELDCVRRGCADLFGSDFRAELRDDHPEPRWSVAVIDLRTGCEYGVRRNRLMTSASVMKIQYLAALTQQAAEDGRRLSATERSLAEAMMHYSLNPETGAIIGRVGNNAALERFDPVVGASDTTHVSPFGATLTTAADRTRVAIATLHGDNALDGTAVEMAREVAAGVHPAQAWGISAGVPADHDVVLKNGFFPLSGFGWRVASSGVVADPQGGAYAITILTDTNDTQLGGIEMVEAISRHVAGQLTDGRAAPRPFDEAICIDHAGGGSWAGLAVALGLEASDAAAVRRVAGGDGPMRGQLICRP